jgi:FkbM family methyltransferase
MTSLKKAVSGPLSNKAYRPLLNLASKGFWRRKYWELLQSLPERDLLADTDHGRLTFSSKDQFIGRSLYTAGGYGYSDIFKAIDILKSQRKLSDANQGYLIDIGANVGTVCIPLVLQNVFARALAFEPEPRNFNYLTRNIDLNHLSDRIQPLQMALSASSGDLELELSASNYGDHRIRLSGMPASQYNLLGERGRRVIKVPVQTLDQTIKSLGVSAEDIQLLWMDVQGHEGHILEGASSVIAAGVPIVFELWPYGLRSAGVDLDWFIEFVGTHFKHLWDLNAEKPEEMAAAHIGKMFEVLKSDNASAQTDVLVF